ncbi:MAG: DNA polymerase III subunit delta', partial [Methyloligellaceae bacterium]
MNDVSVIPEADKLDGFAHPRTVSEVLGHGEAEQTLLDAFKADRMHHAWLLIGPEGIGKATLAYRFARFLLAQGEEGNSQTDT